MGQTRQHHYRLTMRWTGNLGRGTADYRAYGRDHEYSAEGKSATIVGSSDPAFRGDPSRYNPEELLVAALSSCHMLVVLHLCANAKIVVTEYTDDAEGEMAEGDGTGHFTRVTLRPRMVITDASRIADAQKLHERAHHGCFIAQSVNFPVDCVPEIVAASMAAQ
ncbi:MAG TPA: OsmC family protein [Bryobacteraceae bacterium]|nr:OsmC family protein [Bryobacteraceae bacterium]